MNKVTDFLQETFLSALKLLSGEEEALSGGPLFSSVLMGLLT